MTSKAKERGAQTSCSSPLPTCRSHHQPRARMMATSVCPTWTPQRVVIRPPFPRSGSRSRQPSNISSSAAVGCVHTNTCREVQNAQSYAEDEGAGDHLCIPVVDLALSDESCVVAVRSAVGGVGFFHVINHGVDAALTRDVVASGAALFDLPLATKRGLVRGDMRISRGYEISPEHRAVMSRGVTRADEMEAAEPSAAHRIVSERFSIGSPRDAAADADDPYYSDVLGSLFFAPNAWPDPAEHPNVSGLRPAMEAYFKRMEILSERLHRLLAMAMGAPPEFFVSRIDRHCSNLQIANYPTIERRLWGTDEAIPLRKKSHADSGTLTILARGAATEGAAGGLQVLSRGEAWVDVPVLPGGAADGGASALLVNLGNQAQRWSDDRWSSTKHRVTNPDLGSTAAAPRRLSIAFFHKANYDAVIDPAQFVPDGVVSGRNPPVLSGEISRVGLLAKAAGEGLNAAEASLRYHEELMGADEARAAAAESTTAAIAGDDDLGLDRGNSDQGAGAGNDNPAKNCPVCGGTGWKPCGQCGGTGVNQEDLFGGKFVKGDTCWLCCGKCKTMCGNCVDLTDSF